MKKKKKHNHYNVKIKKHYITYFENRVPVARLVYGTDLSTEETVLEVLNQQTLKIMIDLKMKLGRCVDDIKNVSLRQSTQMSST